MSERELIDAGWYLDFDDTRYHGSGGVSSTSLKYLLQRAPNYFLCKQNQQNKPTEAMKMGSLVHTMILEPETVKQKYVQCPEFGDLRKTANKTAKLEFEERNQDKDAVKSELYEKAERMAESVLSHPTASLLLDGSINESSVYWWFKGDYEDERKYKQMCKVRPDAISTTHPGMIIDIKTTDDASFTGFAKSIHKFNYHLSAAMYLEGCNSNKELLDKTKAFIFTNFVWVVVEKEYPYNVACYSMCKTDYNIGRMLFRKSMMVLHDAKEDNFPGYPEEIREIELPAYAQKGHIV